MKTPREILLKRHQATVPKLDATRREVLNAELRAAETSPLNWPRVLWRELVWPCRRIWAGMAAVWLVILVVNFSMRDDSQTMAMQSPPPSPEMILTFRQQERLLAELIGPNETRSAAPPPKPFLPQPRSEGRFETLAA
jgi:hypothetical protein